MNEDNFEYIVPEQAWEKLKASMNMPQPVYIYGAATYGKTELIRRFFGKRKYMYFSCAEGELPDEIDTSKFKEKPIVVIDDMSMIADENKRNNVIELAKRRDIHLIMASRSSVPEWLFPIYIKSGFIIIEESDLYIDRKTLDECMIKNGITLSDGQLDFIDSVNYGNAYCICYIIRMIKQGRSVDESLHKDIADRFISYTQNNVIAQWDSDIAEFLTQLSIVDKFDESLAEYITGNSNVKDLLKKANEIGNFLNKKNDEYFIMGIVLEALRRRAKSVYGVPQINQYAYNAGLYYETHDDIVSALAMYKKCDSSDRIKELLVRNARKNPGAGFYYEMKDYYFRLNEEDVIDNPVLMSGLSMLYGMLMQEEKSEYWYNKLKDFANCANGGELREAKSMLTYLDVSLAHRGSKGILDILTKAYHLLNKNISLPEFSTTSNLPSVINGGKDFCEFTKNDRLFVKTSGKMIEKVLGRHGYGLMDAALAESLFEKGGDIYEILSLASRSQMKTEEGGAPEIAFISVGIQVRLNLLHGNESASAETLSSFERKVNGLGLKQFTPNINAMKCLISLYKSDTKAIENWLNSEAPDEALEFYIMDRYRYIVKIRCYIANGDYLKAYSLLQEMRYYAEKNDRTYILMEVNLFSAVVKYRMGDKNWKKPLSDCLKTANRLKFRRVISLEGAAVLELLENVKKDEQIISEIDEEWFNNLLHETKKTARLYPVYLKGNVADIPDFSKNGLEVLKLQAQGFSISEIAEKLMINIDTVKYHTKQNYKKLGVSGKTDAVLAARNLGIL